MELRPRAFGEILNDGMTMLGHVWRRLVPPSFGAFVILGAITILIFKATDAVAFIDVVINDPGALETMSDDDLIALTGQFLLAGALGLFCQLIAASFVSLAAYRLVGTELAGRSITAGEASLFAVRKTVTFVLAAFATTLLVLAGLVLFIVPGVWALGSLTMIGPAIAMEPVGAIAAMQRSFTLVRGRWWPTIGFILFVGLLGLVASQLVQLIAVPLLAVGSLGIAAGLSFGLAVVVQGFIVAAIGVMTAVWYVDLRTRKEQFLSESLG